MSKKEINIGIFRRTEPGTGGTRLEEAEAKVKKAAEDVQDYWGWHSRGYWNVEVRGYVYQGELDTGPPYYGYNDIRKYKEENPELFEDFSIGWHHAWGGYRQGICGQGRLPGNKSVTYFQRSPCGSKTMCHELGHNFGLYHASSQEDGETRSEYGDRSSIMGLVTSPTGLNGPNLIKLGFYHTREVADYSNHHEFTSKQIYLAPIELSRHSLKPKEYEHCIFYDKGTRYHLSIRKFKGTRYPYRGSPEDTLYVHKMPNTQSNRLLADLKPGESRTLEGGTVVRYDSYKNESAKVSIIVDGVEPGEAREYAMPIPPATPGIKPEYNGLWYNKDFTGEGFDVQINGDKIRLFWMTYSQTTYLRRYYFAEGTTAQFNNGEAKLYTTSSARWSSSSTAKKNLIGKVQMYFFDNELGVINWDDSEHGRGSIEIMPIQLNDSESSGIYINSSRSGDVWTIQFFDNYDRVIINWLTYRSNPGQEWYYCEGKRNGDVYDLQIYQARENSWMHVRKDPGLEVAGTGQLRADKSLFFSLYGIGSESLPLNKVF